MTISYQLDVTHASALSFFRLLFRWRASFWKDIFKELLVWCTMYFMIAFCYRSHFIMNDAQRITFEKLSVYLNHHLNHIPLTFILGFYVSIVFRRWNIVFKNMGYIENEAILIGNYVQGDDEQTKMMRRAMVRYMCLSQLLVYRDISVCVRKRFPTNQSIIQAGFMLEHEEAKLESISLEYDKYWVPINWSYTLFFEARRAKKIASDAMTNKLCDEMKNFRQNLQMLCNYDWVPIPLTYPQVIMVAVYFYFIVCLVSRQFISSDSGSATAGNFEMIVPLMTIIQFVFFVGWMKAAEVLLNPMGEDDDDFETNFLLDKNLATSLNIVDASGDVPITEPDQFWLSGRVQPIYPLSVADEEMNALVGSAVHAKVPGAISTEKRVEMVVRRTTSVSTSQSRIASRRQRFSRQMSSSSVRFDQKRPRRPYKNHHPMAQSLNIDSYSSGFHQSGDSNTTNPFNNNNDAVPECRSASCYTLYDFNSSASPQSSPCCSKISDVTDAYSTQNSSRRNQLNAQKSATSFISTLFTVDEEEQTNSSPVSSTSFICSPQVVDSSTDNEVKFRNAVCQRISDIVGMKEINAQSQ